MVKWFTDGKKPFKSYQNKIVNGYKNHGPIDGLTMPSLANYKI